jgi:hypothetical protein
MLELLSQEYLLSRLSYDPETGRLYWRKHEDMPPNWNARWAGKEAFTSVSEGRYLVGRICGRKRYAHRVIYKMVHGVDPVEVDHINRIKTDNRLANLRSVTSSVNCRNFPKKKNNTSGFNGVYWRKDTKCWEVRMNIGGRNLYLGNFTCKETAIAARISANAKHGFDPSHGL